MCWNYTAYSVRLKREMAVIVCLQSFYFMPQVLRVHGPWVFIFTAHCPKISACNAYKREALNKSRVKTETGLYPKFSMVVKQFPLINAKELNSIIDERCV